MLDIIRSVSFSINGRALLAFCAGDRYSFRGVIDHLFTSPYHSKAVLIYGERRNCSQSEKQGKALLTELPVYQAATYAYHMAKGVAVLGIGATPFNLLFNIYLSGSVIWSLHRARFLGATHCFLTYHFSLRCGKEE